MFRYVVIALFLPTAIFSVPYSSISNAQLISEEAVYIWLYNQSSPSQCLCEAFRYQAPPMVAFNSFALNQTCQLIPKNFSNVTSFYIAPSSISTLFLLSKDILSKIKSICCSDISWLMKRIQQADTVRTATITKPVGLVVDNDLNTLIITYGTTRAIQQREMVANMSGGRHPFSKSNAQPISYNGGFYYVGINPSAPSSSYYFYVYHTNLTRIHDLPFPEGDPQRAVWLYNDALMCLIIQSTANSSLTCLNWDATSFNFSYNRTVTVPFDKPYGLAKSNDERMIYVSGNSATIYQISTTTFAWSTLVLNTNSTEIARTLIIDSCGQRLWALMMGFGIRVYDRLNGNELAAWNMSMSYPALYDMALTADYELYLIDYSLDQLIHYGSSLKQQCTIN